MEPQDKQSLSFPAALESAAASRARRGARALLVMSNEAARGRVVALLNDARRKWVIADHASHADEIIRSTRCEFAVLEADEPDAAFALIESLRAVVPHLKFVLMSSRPTVELIGRALRAEVVDVLAHDAPREAIEQAFDRALRRACSEMDVRERIERLTDICRRLSLSRDEIGEQVEVLCRDLASAYRDIAEQVNEATMVSEFRTLLAQELDLEELLRTALEYLLTKTGPTNAAVFLPTPGQRWELGAYVNYDCPRVKAESFIHHLGEQVCPNLADETEIIRFIDASELADSFGDDAAFLANSQMIAFACRNEDDCLAIAFLFRDAADPFPEELAATLDLLREIFARQIASVIGVHHRAKPQWPREAQDADDGEDDYGFLGGMAA